ncbi:MAG: alpha/beta fold hydrolase [Patescibacteria group bacterium]|nr:alpha/beta fold hydrolase [Patescibacteria group bacterium]
MFRMFSILSTVASFFAAFASPFAVSLSVPFATTLTVATVTIVAVPSPALAQIQPPEVEWEKTFGGTNWDNGYWVQQTADGGYIVTGVTSSFGAGGRDVYLVKTDASGNLAWQKTFGGVGVDEAFSVQQTSDDGYIMAGWTESFGAGGYDVYVVKTDNHGNLSWQKTFGGASTDGGFSVQQTSDGGYAILGGTHSFHVGGVYSKYLIKTNALGNLTWQETNDPRPPNNFKGSIHQTSDGGYIIVVSTSFGVGASVDVFLIKTNDLGNMVWERTFGGTANDWGFSVQQTADGGYIVGGETSSFGAGGKDVYLIKTDASGNLAWQKTFGGASNDLAYSIQQTKPDGGYVIAGHTESFGAGRSDIYLVKTDAQGNLVWQKTIGGAKNDKGYSAQQTFDADDNPTGYIVAGYTESFGAGGSDVYLIKLAPDNPPPPAKIQLYIYRTDTDAWLQLTDRIQEEYFKPTLPVIVLVHGWNNLVVDGLPGYYNELAAAFNARKPNGFNILAWDWMEEAKGNAKLSYDLLGLRIATSRVLDQSAKLTRALQQLFRTSGFTGRPIHLMGHSLGAFVSTFTALELQDPGFGGGVYPVANLTLWDPPERVSLPVVGLVNVPNSLRNNVPYLRTVHGTTVDVYSGTFNDRCYFANAWYSGYGHDTFNWYRDHAAQTSEPTLHTNLQCNGAHLPSTIGFGASRTHALASRELRFNCRPEELGVSLVGHSKEFTCQPNDELVYNQYCIADALAAGPTITVRFTNGIGGALCDCRLPDDVNLQMRLQPAGGGGGEDFADDGTGSGGTAGDLVATFTLPLTIATKWDYLQFTYRFDAAPADTDLTLGIQSGADTVPLFLVTSGVELGEGDRNSQLLDITPYRGKTVKLIFSLSSEQPDAVVEIADLTLVQGAFHENVAPIARPGANRAIEAEGTTTPVTLDAASSTDADDDPLTFVWTLPQADDPAVLDIAALGETPTLDLPLGGYPFTLYVRDPFDGIAEPQPLIIEVEYQFWRGDANSDGKFNIADAVVTLSHLFLNPDQAVCKDAADANDDNKVNIADPIYALSYLFLGGPRPPDPFAVVGLDPTPDLLGCDLPQH